jgi:arginine decarboxylase
MTVVVGPHGPAVHHPGIGRVRGADTGADSKRFHRAQPPYGMAIEIVWGTGEGQSALGAFDAALADGGIHNYNLVTLSSVIPADTEVVLGDSHEREWAVGETVGTVLAKNKSTVTGETVAAGLGWATATEGGVFFEAAAESAENVETLLTRGIETARAQRDWDWTDGVETKLVEHTVERNGAAVVAAVYQPL